MPGPDGFSQDGFESRTLYVVPSYLYAHVAPLANKGKPFFLRGVHKAFTVFCFATYIIKAPEPQLKNAEAEDANNAKMRELSMILISLEGVI